MLFQRMIMTIWNLNHMLHHPGKSETETANLSPPKKMISDIFWTINRGHKLKNGIQNGPTGIVILSAYCTITVKGVDYKTKTRMCMNTVYQKRKKWQEPCFISLPSPTAKNWISHL